MSPFNKHKMLYNDSQLHEMANQEKSTEVKYL